MIDTVPVDTPYTTPVADTVATDVLLLVHTPPAVASLSATEPVVHIEPPPPVIGSVPTLTTIVAGQVSI
jgi:hypothetical protein